MKTHVLRVHTITACSVVSCCLCCIFFGGGAALPGIGGRSTCEPYQRDYRCASVLY